MTSVNKNNRDKEENIFKKPSVILILATLSCLLWGSAIPVLKISYKILGIESASYLVRMQFAGFRFLLAGIYLFVFLLIRRKNLKVKRENFKYLIILGFFQTGLMYALLYNGLANVSGVKASIMISLSTFFAVILPHFAFNDDKMNFKKIIGLILGFSGVVYANIVKGPLMGGFSLNGEGLMILHALVGATATILVKKFSNRFDTILMASYQMILGAVMLIVFSTTLLGANETNITISFIPILMYLALISSAGFGIWFILLSNNLVSKITMYKFQIPIWGSLLSVIFLPDENFNIVIIISLILVSIGIYLVNAPDRYLRNKFKTN